MQTHVIEWVQFLDSLPLMIISCDDPEKPSKRMHTEVTSAVRLQNKMQGGWIFKTTNLNYTLG